MFLKSVLNKYFIRLPSLVLIALVFLSPTVEAEADQPKEQRAIRALLGLNGDTEQSIEGFRFQTLQWEDSAWRLSFQFPMPNEQMRLTVVLTPFDETRPAFKKTKRFSLFYEADESQSSTDTQSAVVGLMEEIARRVSAKEKPEESYFPSVEEASPSEEEFEAEEKQKALADVRLPPHSPDWLTPKLWEFTDKTERIGAMLFLALAMISIGLFLFPSLWRQWLQLSNKERLLFLFFACLALILRIVVDERLVMEYGGYAIIEAANTFGTLPKYGAGALLFYHLFFLAGLPTSAFIAINTATGVLTIVLAAVWLKRYTRMRTTLFTFLFILAIHPLFLRDHNSESIFIPTLFFFFAGLLLWERYRKRLKPIHALAALATLAFSAYCRPLMIAIIPASFIIIELQRSTDGNRPALGIRRILLALGMWFIAMAAHAGYLALFSMMALKQGQLGMFEAMVEEEIAWFHWVTYLIGLLFSEKNVLLMPDSSPFIFFLLWIPALARSNAAQMRKIIALFMLFALAFLPYFLDAPEPSLYRIHILAGYFFFGISAIGLAVLFEGKTKKGARVAWLSALILLLPIAFIWPIKTLWLPNNAQSEHELLQKASEALATHAPFTLARLTVGDMPHSHGIYREYPDSLFTSDGKPNRFLRLSALLENLDKERKRAKTRPLFLYLGMRCYTIGIFEEKRPPEEAPPVHPLCIKAREELKLKPILERTVKNHELQTFYISYSPLYELTLGLYEVE